MSFHGFGGRGPQRAVDSDAHYKTLGVAKDASEADIKKAYRRLAMQHHPDKGGDPEKFTKIQNAHEILSDSQKRSLYDQGGDEAVERGRHVEDDGMDIFDLFGGGGGRRRQQPSGPRKGPPVTFQLALTLEEMFTGSTKKLRLTRSISCKSCDGKGGHGVTDCSPCQGRGIRVVVQRLGPGMISQSQQTCDVCRGEGQVVPPQGRCNSCNGDKVTKEKKELSVPVPPGIMEGQSHTFPSEGDQQPGQLPGDVVVEFVAKTHNVFERKGRHLFYKLDISLLEALTGFTTYIKHLDGKELKLVSTSVIKPGDVMKIEDQGMPVSFGSGRGIDIGNLYIQFNIVFPTTEQMSKFSQKVKQALPATQNLHRGQIAGNPKIEVIEGGVCDMNRENTVFKSQAQDFERFLRQQQQNANKASSQYDDDDDDHHQGGSGGPACQPM